MVNKGNLWDKLRQECVELEYPESLITYARSLTHEYNSKYVENSKDGSHTNIRYKQDISANVSGLENLTLENLNKPLTDDRFTELINSSNDSIPLLVYYDLTVEQLVKLSETERREYFDSRDKLIEQQKAQVQIANSQSKEKKQHFGFITASEELKESTIVPPENLWSKESLSYQIHDKLGDYYGLLQKAHYDIRDNIEKFTPTKEIQEEHKQHFLRFRDRVIIPLANIDSYICKFHKTMMDNITDEKYGDSFLNWLKIAEDKFWSAGNHGSGEINSILTGKYIGKLKTNQYEIDEAIELGEEPPELRYTVVETPIEREYTREQVGDETKFSFNEVRSLRCSKEGCGHENFYKVVPVEISDSVFGDWFNKAKIATVGNELSNQLETICDHVTIRVLRSPKDILTYYNPKATPDEINKLQYIFGQSENMKAVDIDSKAIMKLGYNIIYGRAGRRANKAQHFSDNA